MCLKIKVFGIEAGFKSARAFDIVKAKNGDLWITHVEGDCITRICPKTGVIRNFGRQYSIPENPFYKLSYSTRTGEIFIGTNHGFIVFNLIASNP